MPDSQLDIEIGKRLTEFLDELVDGNSRAFALKHGIDPSQLSKIQKGVRGLTVDKAVEFATTYGIDLNWLLTGVGDMYLQNKSGPTQVPDRRLLTKMRKEIDVLKSSLLRLSDLVPSVQEEKPGQEVTFSRNSSDKTR